ncbi:MAG: outer membrane protein assembly factor BamD [Kiritimatiellae bacterium]|nr:outer membrane protein assembly factor BamD [Kiritimatiellia bacterium]
MPKSARSRLALLACWLLCLLPAAADIGRTLDQKPLEIEQKSGVQARKQWKPLRRPARRTPEEQLVYANGLRARGALRKAIRHYDALVRRWPQAKEAAPAQLALAELLEQRGKLTDAFEEYQYLIEHYVNLFAYDTILERQLEIALTLRDRKRRLLFVIPHRSPEKALPLFEQIVLNGPTWPNAPQAQFNVGRIHEDAKEYELAIVAYMTMQYRYPGHELTPEAAFRHARCQYRLAHGARNDETARKEAILSLARFVNQYPDSAHAAAARQYLAELKDRQVRFAFEKASYYDTIARKPRSAIIAYRQFAQRYPDSDLAATARARVAELEAQLAEEP